jgi:hypothetical protein
MTERERGEGSNDYREWAYRDPDACSFVVNRALEIGLYVADIAGNYSE